MYKFDVHEFADFREVKEQEVKILVICENEKLVSYTYCEISEEGESQAWELTQEGIIMEQYYAFNWPFLVSSFGWNTLLVYNMDDQKQRVFYFRVDQEAGYITNTFLTNDNILFYLQESSEAIRVFTVDLIARYDKYFKAE